MTATWHRSGVGTAVGAFALITACSSASGEPDMRQAHEPRCSRAPSCQPPVADNLLDATNIDLSHQRGMGVTPGRSTISTHCGGRQRPASMLSTPAVPTLRTRCSRSSLGADR